MSSPLRSARSLPALLSVALTALVAFCAAPAAQAAPVPAGLTVTPLTWDTIGLDSNKPASQGPETFPVGARVCNTSGATMTNVATKFSWDSSNAFIDLQGASTDTIGTLAPGACADTYFVAQVDRTKDAFDTVRKYHITATADGGATAQTPAGRQLYVEHLISQNRNTTVKITGADGGAAPTDLEVGKSYTFQLYANTATAYEQLSAFLSFPSPMFRVDAISTTYETPKDATVGGPYADACGWNPNPGTEGYASCTGPIPAPFAPGGKAGNGVVVTYKVTVLAAGEATLNPLIYDKSGSSFHYNADYDSAGITVTSKEKPKTTNVSIHKTADKASYASGDLVTYTLTAHNDGPAAAQNVVVDDDLPAGLTFVSTTPGAPTCTQAGGHVHCGFGTLAPGADRTVTIVTRAPVVPAASTATGTHQLTISKEERYLTLQAGATQTAELTCSSGGTMSDGAAEIMHVDQGTGSPADVRVRDAHSISDGTYRFTIQNATTGQAQVKLFGTCLPPRTDGGDHALVTDGPYAVSTGTLAPGRYTFTVPTSAGHLAVSPGIEVISGVARLSGSEPSGSSRVFTVEVLQTAQVTLSVRGLQTTTGPGGSPLHTHPLTLRHVAQTVTLPVGESVQRVSCPVGYKGIVASYDLPSGVVSLGNEPQPINRDFRLLNTTGHPVDVMLDLECLAIETGTPSGGGPLTIANTGTVATDTPDTNPADDSSTVSITVQPAAPVVTPEPMRFTLGTTARFTRSAATVSVPATCTGAKACAGTLKVSADVSGTSHSRRRTVALGSTAYRIAPHSSAKVAVRVPSRYRSLLRSGRVKSVTVRTAAKTVHRKLVVR